MSRIRNSKAKTEGIVVGAGQKAWRNVQSSKFMMTSVVSVVAIVGAYLIYQSFAAETAQVTVAVNRTTPNGVSKWVPAHTSVSTEFYQGIGQNQGPDTTPGTAQYNARALELEGITQHNVHIMAWARSSPWLNEADGAPDPNLAYNTGRWGGQGMDQEVKRAADKGLQPTITLAMAPGWMIGKRTSGNGIVTPITDYDTAAGFYQARVTTDKMDKWLQLVDSIVKRYAKAPYNVRTYDIWNEFKGYYNPDTNNYDAGNYCGTPGKADMGYTCFYNKTRAQVLASAASVGVTSGIRTGGPYVVSDLWDNSGAGGYPVNDGRGSANNTLAGAKSYGWVDGRSLDAIKTWLQYKSGAEFIALRFSYDTRAGYIMGTDWDALQYAGDLAKWVRGLPEATYPGASTLPFWNAEHYTGPKTDGSLASKQAAFSAESYRIGVRSGYEAMLRWGADGLDGLDLWTTTSVPNNHELRAGDGLPGNGHLVQKYFKQYFSSGTPLYPESNSNSQLVSVLANQTHTMLINKTNTQLTVSLDGALITLAPYDVQMIQAGQGQTTTPPPPATITLKLINADTDQVISTMTNGMTINLATARNLNIDATASVPIESVRFDDAGQPSVTENFPPYAIGGDAGTGSSDYYSWTPTVGTHTMTVKAFNADGGGTVVGSEVASTTISFTVTDSGSTNPNPDSWELLYQDNFDTLNTSSTSPTAWQLYSGTGHAGNGLRQPSAISVAGGILTITAKNVDIDGNGSLDKVSSGGMSNKTNMTYGKYETRVRTDIDPLGIMSGVMLTWPQTGTNWANGENDYYETGHPVNTRTPFKSYIHYPDTPENTTPTPQKQFVWNSDASQWHRVVMEWTPDYINIKTYKSPDGAPEVLVGDQTYLESADPNRNNIPDVPHHATIQLDAFSTSLLQQSVRMQVDYLKVYKMGTGSTTDTTAPTVTWEAPAAGDTVSGQLTEAANNCRVAASDGTGSGVERVEFFLDGAPVNTERSAPYNCFVIDTTKYQNGTHVLGAKAYDIAGNASALVTRSVNFNNPIADTTAPNIAVTAPTNGSTVGGIVYATAQAADPPATTNGTGITRVEFYLDNTAATGTPNMVDDSPVYEYSFNSANLTNTFHTITAKAYDTYNNAATSTVSFTVKNDDTQAPTVPTNLRLNGTVTANSVPLTWNDATDNVGVVKYNVLRNGVVIGSTTGLTYVDPTNNSVGNIGPAASTPYQYSVQAVDAANNASSPSVNLPVTTPPAPDASAPTVPTNLSATATSSSFVALSWTASTDTGGSGLRGYNVYRNGSSTPLNGSTPIMTTSYGDGSVTAATSYTYQVQAVDGANNKSALSASVNVTTPVGPITLSFLPTADAWVSQKFPTRTYGTTAQLKGDAAPNQDMLLRFNVSGIGAKQIRSAKLRFYVANGSDSGGSIHRTAISTWSEASVNWNTSPAADAASLASLGSVTSGSIVEFNLASLITTDGSYGLRINSSSSDTLVFNAKEASSNKPQLVLVVE